VKKKKVQKLNSKFKVGQTIKLQTKTHGRDMSVDRNIRKGTIINKTKEFITVKYTNLGEYKESFNYIDFITGAVKILS